MTVETKQGERFAGRMALVTVSTGVLAAGKIRFLKNIMGLWLVQECRRQWVREGHDHSYAELKEMAGRAKPFTRFEVGA